MTTIAELDCAITPATGGEIAIINLESARQRSWAKLFSDPTRYEVVETVVAHEQLMLQFVGDVSALDRVEALAAQLDQIDAASARVALIQTQVASMAHRFSDAGHCLAQAEIGGAPTTDVDRLRLDIDQACGSNLDSVLDKRRRIATDTGGLENFVAFGSLLADLRDFDAADRAYKQALQAYRDVSPFPIAGVCFQLGVLWGELVPEPESSRAAQWYRRAIAILPMYAKACVHLAEIYSSEGRLGEAEALLISAVSSGDPEVHWRLADVMASQKRLLEAEEQMQVARSGFEMVLTHHLLAFADHGAEFYAGSGGDARRALELARINVANRPTLRAFEQAHGIAVCVGDAEAEAELVADADRCWGAAAGFRSSPLWKYRFKKREGAVV